MSTKIWHNRYEGIDKVDYAWMRAFPLGNGRIGAMCFGDPNKERFEINEESLWAGRQQKHEYHANKEDLDKIRQLIFEKKYEEAQEISSKALRSGTLMSYQYFADLYIDFNSQTPYTDYYKELDLETGLYTLTWKKDGRTFKSTTFISDTYDTMVYKVTCTGGRFTATVSMDRCKDAHTSTVSADTLILNGILTWHGMPDYNIPGGEGMSFGARVKVVSDGSVNASDNAVYAEDASYMIVYAAFETNHNPEIFDIDESIDYKAKLLDTINSVSTVPYEEVLNDHIAKYGALFNRVKFQLDGDAPYDVPTENRIDLIRYYNGKDADLITLYYNFARYLLITSSGGRARFPANLQGIWCDGTKPPWNCDFHININVEMNYWPVESANLPETAEPLIYFAKMLSKFGAKNAKNLYHARGWATHLTSDVFGFTGGSGRRVGLFPMSGPWLCLNLWEHYEYTNDITYLRELYPVLKGACEFVLDYLVESPEGYLVTNPTNSPEHDFYYTDAEGNRKPNCVTYGSTMDNEIIYSLFTNTAAACKILDIDAQLIDELYATLKRLPPLRLSERYDGTLCEWIHDYEEREPGHRHISHLFGLYPGDQINETDPVIFEAAKKSLHRRITHGSGGTGWSMAWFSNFYARLKDSEAALKCLYGLLGRFTAHNMFDMHPPVPLFQIDGNFGGAAGITEMLLQSHLGTPGNRILEVLPALPKEWAQGRICGIKARGNFEVSIDWNTDRILVDILSHSDNTLRIKVPENTTIADWNVTDGLITKDMQCNERVSFTFIKSH